MSRATNHTADRKRIPLSQLVVRGVALDRELRDDNISPDRTRLVDAASRELMEDDLMIKMGEIIEEHDGGSLRTFSGNLTHENGWWPSFKRARVQHWEGATQRQALLAAECNFAVEWAQSEPCCIRFPIGDEMFEWYADLKLCMVDAPDELWEIKKSEKDLEDPKYRRKLAGVAELCRRIGVNFRIVMAHEITLSRHHRDNVELFASRRFITIPPDHMRRFEAFALSSGGTSTYGELSAAIDPRCQARGKAIVQGLTVRRRVEIDLREFLTDHSPVRIH